MYLFHYNLYNTGLCNPHNIIPIEIFFRYIMINLQNFITLIFFLIFNFSEKYIGMQYLYVILLLIYEQAVCKIIIFYIA